MTKPPGQGAGQPIPDRGASAQAAPPIAPKSSQPPADADEAHPPGPSHQETKPTTPSSGASSSALLREPGAPGEQGRYGMAPLIRYTLVGLYLCLVLPLPLLASGGLGLGLAIAVPLGLVLVLAMTSEMVTVAPQGLALGHPTWCGWWLRRGWSRPWNEITGLTAVATSQGGRVYYLRSAKGSYLLPQRLGRFTDFLAQVHQHSGLDTSAIGRISPPWTYQLLAGLTALMLLGELASLVLLPGGTVVR